MSDLPGTRSTKKGVRLCVIASDFGAAVNIGGGIETHVRTFDLPREVIDHILSVRGQWTSVSLGMEITECPNP